MSLPTLGAAARASLALSCVGPVLISLSPPAQAQDAGNQDQPKVLGGVTVTDTAIIAQDQPKQATPKATRPVLDTPQTITVVTSQQMQQQNLLSLQQVLQTVPGITFGAGEGGSGVGDKINLRGFAADTDITIDNVRDSAQYSRSDTFDYDQIEVVNGADSVYSGGGSVGGTINLVSKRPQAQSQSVVTASVGTDDYWRGTADINERLSDSVAVRLNAMVHRNDIPGRDVENNKRWGIAPSITFGMNGPTRLTLEYFHQEDHNIPEYGVPYYQTATNTGPIPGVSNSDYFGYRNIDKQRINTDRATAIVDHDFSDTVSLTNLARWENVRQFSVVDPPQGTYCLTGDVTPAGVACPTTVPVGYYLLSGPRGTTRDTSNSILYDEIDLKAKFDTGPINHTLVLGGSASQEKINLTSGNSLRNADGTATYSTFPLIDFTNPNQVVQGPAGYVYGSNLYTGALNYIPTAAAHGQVQDYAAWAFDTAKILPKLELNVGVRYDRVVGSYRADTISAVAATLGQITPGTTFRNTNNLVSYRVGLVYKPTEKTTLYAAYGNSKTPSQSSINGGCTTATCNVKPASARNIEFGAKADVLTGLELALAFFRDDRNQYLVASNDPTIPNQQLNGSARSQGISVSATGQVTKAWTITANYMYLQSKVLQGSADNCATPPYTTACYGTNIPYNGAPLTNTPKNSGSLFTTYALPFGLTVGDGATYQGSFYLNNGTQLSNTGAIVPLPLFKSHAYWVHQAYLQYKFNDRITGQVNIANLTNSHYYTNIRNSGWAVPGPARSAVFSVAYGF